MLAIDEAEASVVRQIYDLSLGAAGMPLGVKAIVNHLNAHGARLRGKPFQISSVHRILTAKTYSGVLQFNRRSARTGRLKDADDWIEISVPSIITADTFDQVQSSLRARSPKRIAPRLVGNPTLLTGIARCATCDSGMTLRTGKSGRYRYYTCAGCAQKGKTHCPGRSIAMAALDGMVLEHLADRLFTPDRLTVVLEAFIVRSAGADDNRRGQLAQAKRALTEVAGRIDRLLQTVEQGLMSPDDPALKDRLETAKTARHAAAERVRLLDRPEAVGASLITPDKIHRLATALREAMRNGDVAFRKAYLRLFVDRVIVGDDAIRVRGPTVALAKAASTGDLPPAGGVVPSFVLDWRAECDKTGHWDVVIGR